MSHTVTAWAGFSIGAGFLLSILTYATRDTRKGDR